jgi:hypothetical protein
MSVNEANKIAQRLQKQGAFPNVKSVKIVEGDKKKYKAIWTDKQDIEHKTQFGHRDYDDYLTHGDPVRRKNFKARFQKLFQKHFSDPSKAIYWVYRVTW